MQQIKFFLLASYQMCVCVFVPEGLGFEVFLLLLMSFFFLKLCNNKKRQT